MKGIYDTRSEHFPVHRSLSIGFHVLAGVSIDGLVTTSGKCCSLFCCPDTFVVSSVAIGPPLVERCENIDR